MYPWWERLLYSFLSALLGGTLVGIGIWVSLAFSNPGSNLKLEFLFSCVFVTLLFALPGWLIAVPIILSVRNYSGWRKWLWAGLGGCVGPAFLLGLISLSFLLQPRFGSLQPATWRYFVCAGAVSLISTAVYLSLVTREPHPLQPATPSSRSKNA